MQLFSADVTMFKKNEKKSAPEKIQKPPSKVARPKFFFWLGCPNGPKTEIPYHQKPFNGALNKSSIFFNLSTKKGDSSDNNPIRLNKIIINFVL